MKNKNKLTLNITVVMTFCCIISSLTLFLVAGLVQMENWLRILLISLGLFTLIINVIFACIIDMNIGHFECKKCKKEFVPTTKQYIFAPHVNFDRYMKCPNCNKRTWFKKRY